MQLSRLKPCFGVEREVQRFDEGRGQGCEDFGEAQGVQGKMEEETRRMEMKKQKKEEKRAERRGQKRETDGDGM